MIKIKPNNSYKKCMCCGKKYSLAKLNTFSGEELEQLREELNQMFIEEV